MVRGMKRCVLLTRMNYQYYKIIINFFMTLRDGIFDQSAPFSERSRPLLVAETKPLSDADARKLELTMHALFGLRAYECV